jgi:hypothetical protein
MKPSGIDPATSLFVAQCLNHCATACPDVVRVKVKFHHVTDHKDLERDTKREREREEEGEKDGESRGTSLLSLTPVPDGVGG